jgi:MoxR-like ATPase
MDVNGREWTRMDGSRRYNSPRPLVSISVHPRPWRPFSACLDLGFARGICLDQPASPPPPQNQNLPMSDNFESQIEEFRGSFRRIQAELAKMMVGQDDLLEGVLVAFFAGGHVLLEGVPGLGKTMLVRTLADAVNLSFSRVQFTPDLMPADIIGTNVIMEDEHGRKKFQFQPGPVFANIVLADEINRATPKTQSALLEAMQEHQVTVGGTAHPLEEPFLVLATQNPLEMEGTYPLPEAQLDRFFFKLKVRFRSSHDS